MTVSPRLAGLGLMDMLTEGGSSSGPEACGPSDTVRSTVDPMGIEVPAVGEELMTWVFEDGVYISPGNRARSLAGLWIDCFLKNRWNSRLW